MSDEINPVLQHGQDMSTYVKLARQVRSLARSVKATERRTKQTKRRIFAGLDRIADRYDGEPARKASRIRKMIEREAPTGQTLSKLERVVASIDDQSRNDAWYGGDSDSDAQPLRREDESGDLTTYVYDPSEESSSPLPVRNYEGVQRSVESKWSDFSETS